jgi:hypothetical protein
VGRVALAAVETSGLTVVSSAPRRDGLTPTTVYAGTDGGGFKSVDGGSTCGGTGIFQVDGPSITWAGSIRGDACPGLRERLRRMNAVFESTDGGATWIHYRVGAYARRRDRPLDADDAVRPGAPNVVVHGRWCDVPVYA